MRTAPAWLAPLLIGAAVAAGLWWSCLKWPDPQIDFGRELYVPWRLSVGEVLYRDIAYWTGPLSVYWHALLFYVFGPSLRVVLVSNLGVLLLTLCCAFRLAHRLGDRSAALTACLVLVGSSAFSQVIAIGNYNFMAPYRHELTHGLLLGLFGLECVALFYATGHLRWVVAGGAALGFSLLTKVEIVLASASALPLGFGLALVARRGGRREVWRVLLSFALAIVGPPLLALALLSSALPASAALAGLWSPFQVVLSGAYTSSTFIQTGAGLDDPSGRVAAIARATLWCTLGIAALSLLGRVARERVPPGLHAGAALALAFALSIWVPASALLHLGHALPVLLGLGLLLLAARARRDSARTARVAQVAVEHAPAFVFSFALLVKLGLNPRTFHYGFVLAVPALVLWCVVLVSWWPAWLGPRRTDASLLRAMLVAALLAFGLAHVRRSEQHFAVRTESLGVGADRFFGDGRAATFEQLRRAVEAVAPPEATLTVVPEGVMLNYLARRRSAIGHLELIPPELAFFGEARVLAALEASAPELVAMVNRDTREYGFAGFGRDYGRDIARFLEHNYRPRALIGAASGRPDDRAVLLARTRQARLPAAARSASP